MIYLTKELLDDGETEYSIRNKIKNKLLFLVEHGVYSDESSPYMNEIYVCKKYPNVIITGLSAFYIYDLTDYIPERICVATEQHSFPIRRDNVSQSYQSKSFFFVGKTSIEYDGGVVNVYDMERMLIELIRLKDKYPPEQYYEIINSFRKIKHKLDFYKINEYAKHFKNGATILSKIKEVI